MAQEYSQRQLERMVQGEEENPNVQFYEQSKMNPEQSKAAGKRVYQTRLMIKKTQPGLDDFAAYVAQPADIAEWPDEHQYYLNTKEDVGSPLIDILPGLGMDVIQELRDYGLTTITKLCAAKTLPVHLQPAQASARRLNEVLRNEQQENENQEDPTSDRRIDPVDVGRSTLPGSPEPQVGTPAPGAHPGGRINGREGGTWPDTENSKARREEGNQEDHIQEVIPPPTIPGCNWDLTFD